MKNHISLLSLYILGCSFVFSQPFQPVQVDAKLTCFEGNLSIELQIITKDSIQVEGGTLTKQNDSTYVVGNVAAGDNIRIFQITPNETKVSDYLVPVIETEPLFPPLVSSINICDKDLPTKILAFVPAGQTVDWYDAPIGGALLVSGNLELEVIKEGKYYAQTRAIGLPCLSNNTGRTAGIVTVQKTLCPELMVGKIRDSRPNLLIPH